MHSLAATRRYWLPQLGVLGLAILIGTLPFWLWPLDVELAAIFYHPDAVEPWYESQEPLWTFFYHMAPPISALVMLGSLVVLIAGGFMARWRRVRVHALFILLVTVLGPGLVINGVLKENWGRPRPHQLTEFGYSKTYLPPLALGERGDGKSFPSGHSSVGYLLSVFFLIWLRRRPWLAVASLTAALILGTLMGIGRMTAGDHFVSDILWSWIIVYGVALVLYYFVLRIPEREDAWARAPSVEIARPRHPRLLAGAYALTAAAMVSGVLFVMPVTQNYRERIDAQAFSPMPRELALVVDSANVLVQWYEADRTVADVRIKARGFGLPGSRLNRDIESERGVLTYRVRHAGIFTEKDTKVMIALPVAQWDRVAVRVGEGDIRVTPVDGEMPLLDLTTGRGKVIRH